MNEHAETSELDQADKARGQIMPRRTFLKASVGLIAGAGLGGTAFTLLSGKRGTDGVMSTRSQAQRLPMRNPAFGWYALDDGGVRCYTTVPNEGMRVYEMNPVGGVMWRACDGKQRSEEIAAKVAERFSLDYEVCLNETREFLALLEEYNFLVTTHAVHVVQSIQEKGGG